MIILLLLLLAAGTITAQDNIPWGQEFQVNTYTEGNQWEHSVAGLAGGGFVMCWASENQDGSKDGIYAQRYDAYGKPAGKEFCVNNYTLGNQAEPDICSLQDGGFVVCWASFGQDGNQYGVYARRFSAEGEPRDLQFQVNTQTEGHQIRSQAAGLVGGGFVICWETQEFKSGYYNINAQCYDSDGNRLGEEFCVTTYTDGMQRLPDICGLYDGGFIVCWISDSQDGRTGGIYAQRFDEFGKRVGKEFCVNSYSKYNQQYPLVLGLADGKFILFWQYYRPGSHETYARCYDRDGNPMGSEFRINVFTDRQAITSVSNLADGGFVVSLERRDQDNSDYRIYLQRYNAEFKLIGTEFTVKKYDRGLDLESRVSGLSDGGFVVCWMSWYRDGSGSGVFGKRYPNKAQRHELRSFMLLEPKHDTIVRTTGPMLMWQPASDKTIAYPWEIEYTVFYDTLANFFTASTTTTNDTSVQIIVNKGKTWFWKVLAKTFYGDSLWSDTNAFLVSHTATGVEELSLLPQQYVSASNYPNPFNPSTDIQFELPRAGFVAIRIYDLVGRLVRTLVNEQMLADSHSILWLGLNQAGHKVAAGVYLYQIEFTDAADNRMVLTKKMTLVK